MPLDAEDEAAADSFGGTFNGFDDAVFGAAGGDAEAVAGDADGLMMAGIYGQAEKAVALWDLFNGGCLAEQRIRRDRGGVGDGYGSAGLVIDGHGHEVLDDGAAAPDVEHLGAEADGEDGFAHVVGVLEEELVDVFAGLVGGRTLFDWLLAVFLRVDVGGAAGQEDALAVGDEAGGGGGRIAERDLDGLAATALDGGGVLLPGAAAVLEVGGGGDGDGDAGLLHRFEVPGSRFEEKQRLTPIWTLDWTRPMIPIFLRR